MSQILKILFQTGDIFLCGFFCSRYVQLKGSFSDEKKHHQSNLRHNLVEKLSKINVAKFHHWQKLGLCKVFDNAKLHEKR